MIDISDFHNCEESEGKIVCITIDNLGVMLQGRLSKLKCAKDNL